jgi:hypothetical protein
VVRIKAQTDIAAIVSHDAARRLLAQAFTTGPWTTPLPVLATIDPDALPQLADAVLQVARN